MKTSNSTQSLLSVNVKYVYDKYCLSHAVFLMPYWLASGFELAEGTNLKLFGYVSIALWFLYGLAKTSQPYFVLPIFFLFTASQAAFYADMHTLDLILTGACVLIMIVKQYQARFYVAYRVKIASVKSEIS